MAFTIRGLYQTLRSVVTKKSCLLPPTKPIIKRTSLNSWGISPPRSSILSSLTLRTTQVKKTTDVYGQNLFRLPWSSLIRSFQLNSNNSCSVARVTRGVTKPPQADSGFRFSQLGYKTWGSFPLASLILSFPLFVHCEGNSSSSKCGCEPVDQPANNINVNSCSEPFSFAVPSAKCGGSCDPLPLMPGELSSTSLSTGNTISPPPSSPPTERNGMVPMNWCEKTDLSHKVLVRQACQLTVDSVTRVLCETIAAYQDYHEKYRCLLDSLIDALESSRITEGVQLELLDCRIIMLRAEVDNMKGKILELESFMSSIQRLSEATAETAFLGHAEYHSMAMSERLDSAMREMRCIKEESARKERDMIELQSVVIVESGRGLK